MYSMVLVMSMAGAPEVPQFGWNKHGGGCYGSAPVVVQTNSAGCYGGGHGHGMFGGKLKSCFSCFKHKSGGCYGGGYGYSSGPVYTESAPGCGTVVIPPAPGTVVPHHAETPKTDTPKKEMPKAPDAPKDLPKKTDPQKIG